MSLSAHSHNEMDHSKPGAPQPQEQTGTTASSSGRSMAYVSTINAAADSSIIDASNTTVSLANPNLIDRAQCPGSTSLLYNKPHNVTESGLLSLGVDGSVAGGNAVVNRSRVCLPSEFGIYTPNGRTLGSSDVSRGAVSHDRTSALRYGNNETQDFTSGRGRKAENQRP